LVLGITATLIVTGQTPKSGAASLIVMLAMWLAAMITVTVVAMRYSRRWMQDHERRTRSAAEQVAIERRALIEASGKRSRELAEREDRLDQQAAQVNAHVLDMAARMNNALIHNAALERRLSDVTAELQALAEDHNRLVRETLQERADRFRPRQVPQPVRKVAGGAASAGTARARAHADQPTTPLQAVPIPLRRPQIPASRLTEPTQHERPPEGMHGNPA
jgi:uncharacterized membrane-anchored protein YhcB (DUF1043 family)